MLENKSHSKKNGKKTILLVEDEALIAMNEANVLKNHGYEVLTAYNAKKAIETVNQNNIDLILMDIDLGRGKMDGTEAAQEILKEHDIPIVFLSSHTEPEVVEKTEKITSYGYVVKNSGIVVLDTSMKMAFKLFEANKKLSNELAERKRAEEAIREHRDFSESLIETAQVIIMVLDTQGRIVRFNPYMEKLVGYSLDEVKGMDWFETFIQPENGHTVKSVFQKAVNDTRTRGNINSIITKDGRAILVEWYDKTLKDKDDRTVGVLVIGIDITERTQAEEALKESEARFRVAQEMSPDGFTIFHPVRNEKGAIVDFTWRYENSSIARINGTDPQKVIGKQLLHILPDHRDTPVFEAYLNVANTGKTRVIEEISVGDILSKPMWLRIVVVSMGTDIAILAQDITERKQAEKQLQAEEDNLQLTLNSIGDAVISTDNQGRIARMNPVAERLCGWKEAEAYGKKLEEAFHIINADTRKRVDNPIDSVMRTGIIAGLDTHTLLLSKDGKESQIADSAAPIKDDNGIINGVVLVFRDVTEKYEKEWQLKERVKELDCLYKIADIVEKSDITLKEILQQTAEVIPQSWRHPEICEVSITLHGQTFQTTNFTLTEWGLSSDLIVDGFVSGEVTVCYREKKPPLDEGPFLKEERKLLNAVAERLGRIIERKKAEEKLRSIAWMLSSKTTKGEDYIPEYGDVSSLNKDGLILTSVGKYQLKDVASEYLDLLETSTAIYEKNGDYALGIFSSGWCQLMDSASRRLCGTEDNQEALDSGRWLCHESCWKDASLAITENRPVEIECNGGIKMYAVPVHVNGEAVGAINFGYGSPPTDETELKRLSDRYNIPIDELRKNSKAYNPRPQFIIDYAKERIQVAAKNLGILIEGKQNEEALKREDIFLSSVLDNMKEAIIICNEKGEIIRFNESARRLHHLPEKQIPAEQWAEYYDLYYPDGYTLLATEDIPLFRALKGEDVVNVEIMVVPKDNNRHYLLSCNGRQLIDTEGEITGAVIAMFDITMRKQAEEEIQKQLSEKEMLLREVNHRVKNNIATIESLLSLQAGSTVNAEVKTALQNAISRVQSMRVLYEKLLLSKDLDEISIKNYAESLIDSLVMFFDPENNIIIENHIADFEVDARKAVSIGIIINELLTNVFKYAFEDRDKGTVAVSIEKNEKMVTLIIQNNGIGIGERIMENKSPGFGLTIVKMLVEQLEGAYSSVNENGTKSVIQFEI